MVLKKGADGECSDQNECIAGTHDCNMYATCENDIGYFQCTCNDGFIGDGFGILGCSDIDECESNPCVDTEYCVNTMGRIRVHQIHES